VSPLPFPESSVPLQATREGRGREEPYSLRAVKKGGFAGKRGTGNKGRGNVNISQEFL